MNYLCKDLIQIQNEQKYTGQYNLNTSQNQDALKYSYELMQRTNRFKSQIVKNQGQSLSNNQVSRTIINRTNSKRKGISLSREHSRQQAHHHDNENTQKVQKKNTLTKNQLLQQQCNQKSTLQKRQISSRSQQQQQQNSYNDHHLQSQQSQQSQHTKKSIAPSSSSSSAASISGTKSMVQIKKNIIDSIKKNLKGESKQKRNPSTSINNSNKNSDSKNTSIKNVIVEKLNKKKVHFALRENQSKEIQNVMMKQPDIIKQNRCQQVVSNNSKQLINSNFYHKHQNINKIMQIYQQKQQKQLKQCTFNPKISKPSNLTKNNNSSSSTANRSIDKFYNDQIKFSSNAQQKVDQIRQMLEKQKLAKATFHPELGSVTQQLTTRRSSQAKVYDRLYGLSKQKKIGEESERKMISIDKKKNMKEFSKEGKDLTSAARKYSQAVPVTSRKNGNVGNNNGSIVKTFRDMLSDRSQKTVPPTPVNRKEQTIEQPTERNEELDSALKEIDMNVATPISTSKPPKQQSKQPQCKPQPQNKDTKYNFQAYQKLKATTATTTGLGPNIGSNKTPSSQTPLSSQRQGQRHLSPSPLVSSRRNTSTSKTNVVDCQQLLSRNNSSKKSLIKSKNNSIQKPKQSQSQSQSKQSKTQSHNVSINQYNFNNSNPNPNPKKISTKSQQIALQKFIRQVLQVLEELTKNHQKPEQSRHDDDHQQNYSSFPDKLNFTFFAKLMKYLNFIEKYETGNEYQNKHDDSFDIFNQNLNPNSSSPEECQQELQNLQEIWNMLQGQLNFYILTINLIKILCCLMGFHQTKNVQSTIVQLTRNQNQQEAQSFSCATRQPQGQLFLSPDDSRKIKKNLHLLCLTRLKLGQSQLTSRPATDLHFSFKPSISKQSQRLAQKYRQRIIKQSQPLIQSKKIDFKVPEDGMIQHVDLLMLDKKRKQYFMEKQREKVQIRESERQWEQEQNEQKQQSPSPSIPSYCQQPISESAESYQSSQSCSQGFSATLSQSASSQFYKTTTPQPLLYLNVSMEGYSTVKVPVFSQDDFDTLTQKVQTLMGMKQSGPEEIQKLKALLETQIMPVLRKISWKQQKGENVDGSSGSNSSFVKPSSNKNFANNNRGRYPLQAQSQNINNSLKHQKQLNGQKSTKTSATIKNSKTFFHSVYD